MAARTGVGPDDLNKPHSGWKATFTKAASACRSSCAGRASFGGRATHAAPISHFDIRHRRGRGGRAVPDRQDRRRRSDAVPHGRGVVGEPHHVLFWRSGPGRRCGQATGSSRWRGIPRLVALYDPRPTRPEKTNPRRRQPGQGRRVSGAHRRFQRTGKAAWPALMEGDPHRPSDEPPLSKGRPLHLLVELRTR